MSEASIAAWVQALASNGPLHTEARSGLLALGEAAVPHLTAALADRALASRALGLLRELGPAAQAAIPAIIADVRFAYAGGYTYAGDVAAMLAAFGAPAIPAALELLDPLRPNGAEHGLRIVARLGPAARVAVPAVIALFDRGLCVNEWMNRALAAIGDAAVSDLITAIGDPSPRVRMWAIRALGELRRPDAQASLIPALDDASHKVRVWAARALGRLGAGMTPATIDGLIEAFDREPHPWVRQWIVWALGQAARMLVRGRSRYRHAPDPALVEALRTRVAPRLVAWLAVRDERVHAAVVDAVLGLEPVVRGSPELHAAYLPHSRLRALLRRQAEPRLPGPGELDDEADDDTRREWAYAVACLASKHLDQSWRKTPGVEADRVFLAAARPRLAAWMGSGRDDLRFAAADALGAMIGHNPDPALMQAPIAPATSDERAIAVEARRIFETLHERPPANRPRRWRA